MSTINEIQELVNGRYPIIWIDTFEERRVMRELFHSDILGVEEVVDSGGVATTQLKETNAAFIWSATQGLIKLERSNFKKYESIKPDTGTLNPVVALTNIVDYKLQQNNQTRLVCVMRDLHTMNNNPMPARKLRDISWHLAQSSKTVIIVGPSMKIPPELQKEITLVTYDFPDPEMIRNQINSMIGFVTRRAKKEDKKDKDFSWTNPKNKEKAKKYRIKYSEETIREIVKGAQGLTHQEILCATSRSLENTPDGEILPSILITEKKSIINKSEILEFWDTNVALNEVGGNDVVKQWLEERGKAFDEKAMEFGLRSPKGCLLVGVQGCGKSMLAKGIAGQWKVPCIRLDVGKVFAGLVGSSEQNMRNMIAQAEAMSPCVTGNTMITLADSSTIRADELYERVHNGEVFDLMGINHTQNDHESTIATTPMKLHTVIRRDATNLELLEFTTTDNNTITVTEDHKFLVRTENGLDWKKAKHVTIHDEIESFNIMEHEPA